MGVNRIGKAAAYAGATGSRVIRGSEGYGPSPFEEMVQIIWKALDIEKPKSVEHLVRKHTERRRACFGEPNTSEPMKSPS